MKYGNVKVIALAAAMILTAAVLLVGSLAVMAAPSSEVIPYLKNDFEEEYIDEFISGYFRFGPFAVKIPSADIPEEELRSIDEIMKTYVPIHDFLRFCGIAEHCTRTLCGRSSDKSRPLPDEIYEKYGAHDEGVLPDIMVIENTGNYVYTEILACYYIDLQDTAPSVIGTELYAITVQPGETEYLSLDPGYAYDILSEFTLARSYGKMRWQATEKEIDFHTERIVALLKLPEIQEYYKRTYPEKYS